MSAFQPRIVGFVCNWCTYAAADLAGTSRLRYPPNLRLVRVMCSGRLDPAFILRAFALGADGVFIGGCHPGDCHYISGNYRARKRLELLRVLLASFGYDPRRLCVEWISAAEGNRFARAVTDFTAQVRALGPAVAKSA